MRNKIGILRIMALVCLVVCGAACTTVEIEYDRMTGTAFPQPETVGSDTVTFTSIYIQGDILLVVDEDDTTIAPLTGPFNAMDPNEYDYITKIQIEALEATNRGSTVAPTSWECQWWNMTFTCTKYHLYGIVVDHFKEYDNGTRSTGTMGWMYDSTNRSAFVQYYKNTTNNSDNGKFLRSAAHEVGHAFNLNHCDGDGSLTIMNQTGTVGNTYTYEFSATSLDHLQNHDRNAVWPGLGPRHYACPHVH